MKGSAIKGLILKDKDNNIGCSFPLSIDVLKKHQKDRTALLFYPVDGDMQVIPAHELYIKQECMGECTSCTVYQSSVSLAG